MRPRSRNPTQSAEAEVTILSAPSVIVDPGVASVALNQRASFTAVVLNSANTDVTWDVNGVANGNSALGQVCLPGTNPCQSPVGAVSGSIDYLAPAALPASDPVTLSATSAADPAQHGSAQITILAARQVSASIAPLYAFVAPAGDSGSTLQFTASVSGASNQGLTWQVGPGIAGTGCLGSDCGSIDASGLYAAPAMAPSPNEIMVTAVSQSDPSVQASAFVAITSGATIEALLPSSVTAGAISGFTLEVQGLNFVGGASGAGSQILINNLSRATSCESSNRCFATLQPADVAVPGTLVVQAQNPGSPSVLSNAPPLVVNPFSASAAVISLDGANPIASGKDIMVADPSNAGEGPALNIDFAGPVTQSGGNSVCNVQASPIVVARPSSGTTTVSICIHGNGLDPSFLYQFSGPSAGNDISASASSLAGLFPNLIQLDLTISSSTLPGARALFVSTPNNDVAVASGLIEVR